MADNKFDEDSLQALKIAFTYMPRAIEVNRFDHGDDCDKILDHIATVREALLLHGIDPDEVYDDIDPEHTPNSSY